MITERNKMCTVGLRAGPATGNTTLRRSLRAVPERVWTKDRGTAQLQGTHRLRFATLLQVACVRRPCESATGHVHPVHGPSAVPFSKYTATGECDPRSRQSGSRVVPSINDSNSLPVIVRFANDLYSALRNTVSFGLYDDDYPHFTRL